MNAQPKPAPAPSSANPLEDSPIARQWLEAFETALAEVPALTDDDDVMGVYRVMHDAKGLGPTFGYQLVGEVAARVANKLHKHEGPLSEADRKLIRAAHATLSHIMSKDLKGDGGDAGVRVLAELDAIVAEG
jgi:hypothetical protein